MHITESKVTKLVLTDLDRLDPVTVILEDLGKTQGKVTIDCYGKAWTNYWGSMGDGGIAVFMNGADTSYIAGKLFGGDERVVDYQAISDAIGSEVERDTMMWYLDELKETYGPDAGGAIPVAWHDDRRHAGQ